MYVSPISLNFKSEETRKLIPLKEFSGPILELTVEEKKLIEEYQKEIDYFEDSIYKLKIAMDNVNRNGKLLNFYWYKLCDQRVHVDVLKQKIKDIKVNRHNIQKELFSKGIK